MIEIEGIIPVKTYSERVPNKNLRKFSNINIFELKLTHLSKTKEFKNFIISSKSPEVLNIASKFGFQTHLSDKYFSTSHVTMSEVYSHLASPANCKHVA